MDLVVSYYTSVDFEKLAEHTIPFFIQCLYLPPAPPRVIELSCDSILVLTILTCITTGSPATTVTWRRDGHPLAIDGHTYHMVQTVTHRASSTYENVLTVSPPALGSTFTCAVSNILGSSAMSNSVTGMPSINVVYVTQNMVGVRYLCISYQYHP